MSKHTPPGSLLAGRIALRVVLCLALVAPASHAQDTVSGAFEGTVSNSRTRERIAGAFVQIINQASGVTIPRFTDPQGRFYQGLLPPGIYLIRVSAKGFKTREKRQRLFTTGPNQVIPIPVALDPEGGVTAAAVTPAQQAQTAPAAAPDPSPAPSPEESGDAGAAELNRNDARRSGAFTETEVSTLPLGTGTLVRTFDELTLLLPGIAPPPQTLGSVAGPGVGAGVGSAGQFSANGLRSRGNNFTVDGSDNNDEDIGVRRQGFVALIPQPIESIKEYQVITLLAPAQFGRNIGAQVNAVSKSGGRETHGTLYGSFNSSQLNARNFFDTADGNATTALRAGGRPVLLNGRPLAVTNQSGGEDSFTLGQGGFVLGGALLPTRAGETGGHGLFYFLSAEAQLTRASREANFAVPTVAERGLFNTGASGITRDPFDDSTALGFPTTVGGDAIFSLFPFPNNPQGIYGENTLTQVLPAGGQGKVYSAKIDDNFQIGGRPQSFTARYNFTDDFRDISVTGGAIFSTLRPRIRTQNLSTFLSSELSRPGAARPVFNQLRASYGRTRLVFDERRNTEFLLPSRLSGALRPEDRQFLLNARLISNETLPAFSNVRFNNFFNTSVEDSLGPVGQVSIAGFSPVGVDVFNFPQRRVNNTYQLADMLTARLGRHSLAFGADFSRTELNSDLPRNARPLITFNGAPRFVPVAGGGGELRGFFNPVDLAAASAPSGVFQALNTGQGSAINLRYYQYNYFAQDSWRIRPNLSLSYGLRYEYNTPPREANRRIEDTFDSPALNLAPGLRRFIDGRTQIFDPDRNNFGPRVGIAYAPELFGAERATVLRAGFGLFYDQAIGAVVSQSRNVFPNFLTLNLAGGRPSELGLGFNISNPSEAFFTCRDGDSGARRLVPITQPGTLNQLNPNAPLACLVNLNAEFPGGFGITLPARDLKTPMAAHYAFSVEQQLGAGVVFSAAYVGTQGRHLLRLTTPNLGPNALLIPTGVNIVFNQPNVSGVAIGPNQQLTRNGEVRGGRPVAGAGAVYIYESTANSRYDSLQLQMRGRLLSRSLQYQLAYTLSKAVDDVSDVFDLAGASALPQNSLTLAGERAPANFDARHRFSYSFIYDLPSPVGRSLAGRMLLEGWQIAGTGRLQSGQPYTVNSIFDVNLDGNLTDRLDTLDGLIVTGDRRQPLRLAANSGAGLLAPVGQDGRIGRNSFRAGNIVELDLAFSKNFALPKGQRITLRADLFNFINRANYGIPVRFLGAPGFGQAVDTVTPAGRVQFVLKYSF